MGLDQYSFVVSRESVELKDNLIVINSDNEGEKIHYWRKHPSLQGWMENLYCEKGGKGEFNCTPVVLLKEDLERLKNDILENKLPYTTGFFFGMDPSPSSSNPEELEAYNEQKLDDLDFVDRALKEVSNNKIVYYTSWW